jgi:hypothetical protein
MDFTVLSTEMARFPYLMWGAVFTVFSSPFALLVYLSRSIAGLTITT